MNINAELGQFSFSFQVNGKLERLAVSNGINLLYESTQPVEMALGRFFTPAGWDECFPTIEPYGDSPMMGDLVGLAPQVQVREDSIQQVWQTGRFQAERTFRREGPRVLRVDFSARNVSGSAQEVLWANHVLLAVNWLQRVVLPDGTALRGFVMDGSERKWFLPTQGPVVLEYGAYTLSMTTDQPWWGIWWDKGGWPVDSPGVYNCLGVEATNTAAEVPGGAWLAPGETFSGWARLAVDE